MTNFLTPEAAKSFNAIMSAAEMIKAAHPASLIYKSWTVPPGRDFYVGVDFGMREGALVIFVHPWFNLMTMQYRPPFYTRYTLGAREARRDRRRHG